MQKKLGYLDALDEILKSIDINPSAISIGKLAKTIALNINEISAAVDKLVQDGYVDKINDLCYKITFDGKVFIQSGGYVRQKELEDATIFEFKQEKKRAEEYQRKLLAATWFAGIAAGLVLIYYIFSWFFPNSGCFIPKQ